MGWNRALQKNSFSSSDFFFRTCLYCFQSMKPGLATALTSCAVWLWKAEYRKPRKRQWKRVPCQDSNLQPSSLKSSTLTIMQQEPCLQGILPSHSLSLPWLQRAGFSMGCSCEKSFFHDLTLFPLRCSYETQRSRALQENHFSGSQKNPRYSFETRLCKQKHFSGSKKCFFPRCSHETQTSPAFKKKSGSKKSFFRMPLVKSANSTSLPRLSSLQIVQMHAIHTVTKNALRIWGTLGLLWCKFACI